MLHAIDTTIPDTYIELCSSWHSGQACMMYAVLSTGGLERGTHRPWNEETGDYATDDEWTAILWRDLSCDVAHAARMAERSGHLDALTLREFEAFCDDIVTQMVEAYSLNI